MAEKKFTDEDSPRQPFKVELYTVVAVIFFILAALSVKFFQTSDKAASFHEEIFPSDAISYIKNNQPVALPDGDYELAMPAGGTFVNGVAPMMLVKVDGEFYPLNIADDSILPRQGRQLPARILFGFTSLHASNTLKYEEKKNNNPVADYKRKALYYLQVSKGFGEMQRKYHYEN